MGKTLKKKIERQIMNLPEQEVIDAVVKTSKRYKFLMNYIEMVDTTFIREYGSFSENSIPCVMDKGSIFSIYGPRMPYPQYATQEKKMCESLYTRIKNRYIELTHHGHGYEDYRKFKYEHGKSMMKGFNKK